MAVAASPNAEWMNSQMEMIEQLSVSTHKFKPALDFLEGVLYMTLPYQLNDGSLAGMIVTSQREVFNLNTMELMQRSLTLSNTFQTEQGILTPTPIGRWSKGGVSQFLSGRYLIDPCELFEQIRDVLTEFVCFDDTRLYDYLSILVILTYVKPIFDTVPIIGINGPPESGKTRLLEILEEVAFNASFCSSITASSMTRMIERDQTTLLVDEAEELIDSSRSEVFKILRACYKKSGKRIVASKTKGDVNEYSVYALTFVVNIAGFHQALLTRMVPISMSSNKQMPQFIRQKHNYRLAMLRDSLYCFAMQFAKRVAHLYINAQPIDGLEGRDYEVWIAPLTIARLIDEYAEKPSFFEMLLGLGQDVILAKKQMASITDVDSAVLAGC